MSWDKIKEKERRILDQLGQTPKEEAIPALGKTLGEKKNTKTNLAYFKVSLEINAEQGQL